jgi:hypothetical protein
MMTAGAGVVIWAIMGVTMPGMITGGHQEGPQPHRADRGQPVLFGLVPAGGARTARNPELLLIR